LGVKLPPLIQGLVDNFVEHNQGPKINPFLEEEIKITASFRHVTTGQVANIDAFYNREFDEYMNPIPTSGPVQGDQLYNALGGYTYVPTEYDFLVRFAPPKNGLWNAKITIITPNQTIESATFSFNVIESGNPGYMAVSPNGRYLYHNSKTFMPVGSNALWPETSYKVDPTLWNYWRTQEGYCTDTKVLPRVYDVYRERLNQMVDNGANYVRTIMSPVSTDIEWATCGDYTQRLFMAQEMDQILELAEQRNFFIQWNTQVHYALETPGSYAYAWDGKMFDGDDYGYSKLSGVTDKLGFYTDPEAKKFYKQRLRYILSRWGYSTQISIFELLSEINHSRMKEYHTNTEEVHAWMSEMGQYIKSQYNGQVHLLTGSFTGAENWLTSHPYYTDDFDVWGINMYDHMEPSFGSHLIKNVSQILLNRQSYQSFDRAGNPIKPLILSELGIGDDLYTTVNEPLPGNCEDNVTELRRQMWQGPFSGAAGCLEWSVWYYPQLYPEFNRIKQFLNEVNFEDDYTWRPGSSKYFNVNGRNHYDYNENAVDLMDNEKEYRADMLYLVSEDQTRIAGVVTNKTFNHYTSSSLDCNLWHNFRVDIYDENGDTILKEWNCDHDLMADDKDDYGEDENSIYNKYILPYSFYPFHTDLNHPFDNCDTLPFVQNHHMKVGDYTHENEIDVPTWNLEFGFSSSKLFTSYLNDERYDVTFYQRNGNILDQYDDHANFSSNRVKVEIVVSGNEAGYIVPFKMLQSGSNKMLINNDDTIAVKMANIIYPNPCINYVKFQSLENVEKAIIRDFTGKIVLVEEINEREGIIELEDINPGVYILYLVNFSNEMTFKLIKI
jgi:hypothetical protein